MGQAIGRKDRARMRRAIRLGAQWAGVVALLLTVGFAIMGPAIIALMATSEAVRAAAGTYLAYVILAQLDAENAFMRDGK